MKDYYDILGIGKDADEATIKKSFRDLAKKYHPDKNRGNNEAEKRFKEVNEAYEILSNPQKRKQYDQVRTYGGGGFNPFDNFEHGGQAGSFNFSDIGDLGDILGSVFGGSQGGFEFKNKQQPRRGGDIQVKLDIPFEIAAKGGKSNIRLQKENPRSISVNIPTGIDSGQRIKLAGEGKAGILGAPAGDLIIEVNVKPNPDFERDGINIISEHSLNLEETLLGTKIGVKTLHGEITLTVPECVQPGSLLRIREHGIRLPNRKGDHLVRIQVQLPKKLAPRQKELVAEFAKLGLK